MLELGDYNIGNGALETDGHGYCLRSLQVCVGDIEEEAICGFWVHLGVFWGGSVMGEGDGYVGYGFVWELEFAGGGHGGLGEGVKSDGHEEWEEKKTAGWIIE
ncbi:unnamed protein product [Prunus armeniaca]